jgi:NAD(P)-dependent dehydrogenase (short-subunit alcohol dehydrogenase family)
MKYEIPAILNSGGGCIVNTGSITSCIGQPMVSPYVASKHGVVGLTKSIALECVDQNIRVNAVCPGLTSETGMFEYFNKNNPDFVSKMLERVPMQRFGNPREFAGIVRFLCSDDASYITGQAIYADGGYTVP